MTNRFERAVQALVSAYMNDTLEKGNCYACAVGNICAAALGKKMVLKEAIRYSGSKYKWDNSRPYWQRVFITSSETRLQETRPERYIEMAKHQIDETGYSWQELAMIELAFETNTKIDFDMHDDFSVEAIDADRFNGLMAVVDVLCEIEGIADAAEYKALFAGKVLAGA